MDNPPPPFNYDAWSDGRPWDGPQGVGVFEASRSFKSPPYPGDPVHSCNSDFASYPLQNPMYCPPVSTDFPTGAPPPNLTPTPAPAENQVIVLEQPQPTPVVRERQTNKTGAAVCAGATSIVIIVCIVITISVICFLGIIVASIAVPIVLVRNTLPTI